MKRSEIRENIKPGSSSCLVILLRWLIKVYKSYHPYQTGKPIDELKRELGLNDIIKLASNENPLGLFTLGDSRHSNRTQTSLTLSRW